MEPLTAGVAVKLSEKLVSKAAEAVSPTVKHFFIKWKSASNKKAMARALKQLATVKTMLHVDAEVDLASFYYPSKISENGGRRAIENVDALGERRNYLLQGTVGQGKSIFLRYLAIQEVLAGARIPVYFELRRVAFSGGVLQGIHQVLETYGFKQPEVVFKALAESGKVLLCLDAFDEVPESSISSVFNEIENIAKLHPELQILVTSRPDGGLASSPLFRVIKLAPLEHDDHDPFLHRLIVDEEQRKALLARIQKSPMGIQDLLKTPLTLSLLVLVYRSEYDIPPTLAGFYSHLFWAILARHEKSKMGASRRRKCQIGDRELEELFSALCFCAKVKGYLSFTTTTFHEALASAKTQTKIGCDSVHVLEDLTKHVCLLSQDGLEFKFVHQSIQEYFGAFYVRSRTPEFARKFYAQLSQDDNWRKWVQELSFLSEIDRYRYVKEFLIPQLNELICMTLPSNSPMDWSMVKGFLDGCRVTLNATPEEVLLHSIGFGPSSHVLHSFRRSLFTDSAVFKVLFSRSIPVEVVENLRQTYPEVASKSSTVSLVRFLEAFNLSEELCSIANRELLDAKDRLQRSNEYIQHEDSKILLLEE